MQTQPSPANTEPIYLSRTSEAPAEGSPGHRPARVDTVDTPEEFATIGHMRGWCHDTTLCAICIAHVKVSDARADIVRMEAHVRTANARRINADIATAQIARDLIEAEHRADMAEARLDSIISG